MFIMGKIEDVKYLYSSNLSMQNLCIFIAEIKFNESFPQFINTTVFCCHDIKVIKVRNVIKFVKHADFNIVRSSFQSSLHYLFVGV